MSKRQKEWARTARTRLVASLGGACVACGTTDKLELDCIRPMGRRHHGVDPSVRVSFYRAQARAGNLQLLCQRCNSMKGDLSQADWKVMLQTIRSEMARDTGTGTSQSERTTINKGGEQ